jgi:hypothetical protein
MRGRFQVPKIDVGQKNRGKGREPSGRKESIFYGHRLNGEALDCSHKSDLHREKNLRSC